MKRITSLVVALAAVIALVAAFSAASASAGTVLCDEEVTSCPLNSIQPAGSYVITGDTAGFPGLQVSASGLIEFECSQNTMEAESKATLGSPLAAEFDGTLSGCLRGKKTPCTGSMNKPATTLEGTATGGLMKIGTAAEPLALTFECEPESPAPYKCTYKMKDTLTLDIQEEKTNALFKSMYLAAGSAGSCNASSPNLSVRNQQSFGGAYISKYSNSGTVICKTTEEPCAEANRYGSGTSLSQTLKSGTNVVFTNPLTKSECSSSSLSGQLTGAGGVSQNVPFKFTSASFTGCGNATTLTVEGLPWEGSIAYLSGSESVMRIFSMKLKWSRVGVVCYYAGDVDGIVKNNSEVVFNSSSLTVQPGSSGLCKSTGSWTATYSISAPSPFYVSWL